MKFNNPVKLEGLESLYIQSHAGDMKTISKDPAKRMWDLRAGETAQPVKYTSRSYKDSTSSTQVKKPDNVAQAYNPGPGEVETQMPGTWQLAILST